MLITKPSWYLQHSRETPISCWKPAAGEPDAITVDSMLACHTQASGKAPAWSLKAQQRPHSRAHPGCCRSRNSPCSQAPESPASRLNPSREKHAHHFCWGT